MKSGSSAVGETVEMQAAAGDHLGGEQKRGGR